MNCNHCQSPLEEGNPICPSCGWDNSAQEPEAPVAEPEVQPEEPATELNPAPPAPEAVASEVKPVNKKKLGLVIGGVILVIAIIAGIVWAVTRSAEPEATEPTLPGDSASATGSTEDAENTEPTGVLIRSDYTYEGEDVPDLSQVAATMEGKELTNEELQVYYWMTYYNFLNQYGSYISYFGLDTTQPLGQQACTMSQIEMTWEQFFLANALDTWSRYQALVLEAEANGFTLSEESQTQLDSITEQLTASAEQYGFESVNDMLAADMGEGATLEAYISYMTQYVTSMEYYYHLMDELAPTDEEISAYYDENSATFQLNGVEKDETPASISVRHILIQPEGDKEGTDESGNSVYSEEQIAAAREAAQAIYDTWLAGDATEESFTALVADNSADTGSSSNGGLYEGVTPGQMVTAFNDWCFDPIRQPGDSGLVDTEFGCHIMYFVSASEDTYWYSTAKSQLVQEKGSAALDACLEKHPYETDYDVIILMPVDTSSAY